MVEYTKYASDTKKRIRELAWMNGRLFIFLAACVLPVSAYFFLLGFFDNAPEPITMGVQTLTVVAVLLAIYVTLYVKTKKAVTANFDKLAQDNKIDFTLERIDENTLEFTRLTDGESILVARSDIKSIKHLKTINVFVLKNKKIIDFPKRPDIDELIHFS